jgi:hypothetical protein
MSEFNLLLDVAKVRHAELAREVEMTRTPRSLRRNRKSTSIAKKIRSFLHR